MEFYDFKSFLLALWNTIDAVVATLLFTLAKEIHVLLIFTRIGGENVNPESFLPKHVLLFVVLTAVCLLMCTDRQNKRNDCVNKRYAIKRKYSGSPGIISYSSTRA